MFIYKMCALKYKMRCNLLHDAGETLGVSVERTGQNHFGNACETLEPPTEMQPSCRRPS